LLDAVGVVLVLVFGGLRELVRWVEQVLDGLRFEGGKIGACRDTQRQTMVQCQSEAGRKLSCWRRCDCDLCVPEVDVGLGVHRRGLMGPKGEREPPEIEHSVRRSGLDELRSVY